MAEMLRDRLIREEGLRLFPYKDSRGNWTIGVGHNIMSDPAMLARIDYYQHFGINNDYALQLLDADIASATESLLKYCPWVDSLDSVRQDVLIDMTFNMGIMKLLKFKNTLLLVQYGKYEEASEHMLKTPWADEVGLRADHLAEVMKTGVA
jgi:lysozyme